MSCRPAVATACLLLGALAACATSAPQLERGPGSTATDMAGDALRRLLPAPVLLVGEQHDAPEHQQLEAELVQRLADSGRLAALVIEMADHGLPQQRIPQKASETQVQTALHWSPGWPWSAYGPVVMAAVRAGIPVLGGNLPRGQMRAAMADEALDVLLDAAALAQQRERIRDGHCGLLPPAQIAPMTRVQIARDRSMAQTLAQAVRDFSRPGQTVLLVAGHGHVQRTLGVPVHLTALPHKILMARADAPGASGGPTDTAQADAVWRSPARPPRDHCAELRQPAQRPQAPEGHRRPATMHAP